jgi:diacylglycerol kinase (ATP)
MSALRGNGGLGSRPAVWARSRGPMGRRESQRLRINHGKAQMKTSEDSDFQPSRTRFFIIHNPNAGPTARQLYRVTLSSLKQLGARIEIVDTTLHGDGTTAADAAKSGRFDAVVAAGGDGTAHDVAEGLVGRSTPLGIIPMGTGNVFAQEIHLPRSPGALAGMLMHGQARDIPVGKVNGRPFLFVIGVGFDAEAVRLFESEGSREFGQVGFVWPVLRALTSHKDRPLHITTNRGVAEAHWVIVTRAKHYAGNLILAPDADIHQDRFFVLRIKGSGPLNRVRQLAALALGVINHDPAVHVEPATRVRIDGDRAVPVQIDGELLGELPLEIGLHPERLNVIFPVA